MKQLEIMNRMVKSVNKLNLVVLVLFYLLFLCQICFAQKEDKIDQDKYEIIYSAFKYSNEKIIEISGKTMGFEVWMNEVWGEEYSSSYGVGFCLFEEDEKLAKAFEELRFLVKDLESKKLSKKRIDTRFKLYWNPNFEGVMTLSEPIIVGNFAFLFRRSEKTKSLYVQKKNSEGKWDYECGYTIYGQLY